jgi:hypothetical protein
LREAQLKPSWVTYPETAIFTVFFELFDHLLNSGEKTNNSRRNCLTALKTANIMPDGGRDFILTTRFAEPSLSLIRRTVALAVRSFSKLSTGAAGQENGVVVRGKLDRPLSRS